MTARTVITIMVNRFNKILSRYLLEVSGFSVGGFLNEIIKVGVTACSNGLSTSCRETVEKLTGVLSELSLEPVLSEYIFAENSVFQGTGKESAKALMEFYADDEVKAIFDISGGDIANEIISYLDFDFIGKTDKKFWGYSDLTTIINALYTKAGKTSVLYQVRNLVYAPDIQIQRLSDYLRNGGNSLFDFPYEFVQGESMEGIVVGGNIRCFLKLAGTDCFPDLNSKILLLESLGGYTLQIVTYLSQLRMLGAFEKVNGVLLGTFTKMEEESGTESIVKLVREYAGEIPVAKTQFVGHGTDSFAVEIGKRYVFHK